MLFLLLFIVAVVASVIAVPWVIVCLPADYFRRDQPPQARFSGLSLPIRVLLLVVKNAAGIALVGVGIVFLVLPGQGLIVILIGVLLLDFPRKRELERWLISRAPILRIANWLRATWRKEPLRLD